jgi:radical SAM protein with 4Fe4S-binding SPASM domain
MTVNNNYQDAPNALQIELAEGCNLACSFCGIQSIRNNGASGPENIHGKASSPYKFLSVKTMQTITDQLKKAQWSPRIEFAMHGEPTMHPFYHEVIAHFRKELPRASLMMTSNGGGLLKSPGIVENVNKLMENGLNVLFLDNYDRIKIVDKIQAKYTGPYPVLQYPANKKGNPHRRRKPSEKDIVVGVDLTIATDGTHSQVSNHAGNAFPLNKKAEGKRCAKPFREMSIRWDGNIAICCNDWVGEYKCGNIMEQPLDEIWQNEAFYSARQKLYYGMRDFGPCRGCDNTTLRNGLLPDRMGKQVLPGPDEFTDANIKKALDGEAYTPRVKKVFDFI